MTSPGPEHPQKPSPSVITSGRLGRIVRGYLGACFVAAWALPLGLIGQDIAEGHQVNLHLQDVGIVVGGFFIVMLIAAAPFATAGIVVTESLGARAIWIYLTIGAATGLTIALLSRSGLMSPLAVTRAGWGSLLIAPLAGSLGGLVYWAIAIRGSRPLSFTID